MSPGSGQKLTIRRRLLETWRLWAPPLRWRASATRELWQPAAGKRVRFFSHPEHPEGYLDFPAPETELRREPITISGWVLFPENAVSHIDICLDDELLGRARLGIPRPDLVQLREQPRAGTAGFELTADLKDWGGRDGIATMRVVATSTAGATHELKPVEVDVGTGNRHGSDEEALKPLPPRTPRAAGGRGHRILVATHQLNLGGAQLYLLDLLSELVKNGAIEPTVVSAMDGRLRKDLEELGIPVHISGPVPTDDISAYVGRVEELVAWAADRDFEAVLINTATAVALPGAEVASELEIPAVWAIHESFAPSVLWSGMGPEVRERAKKTLSQATLAVFEAEATQRLYEPLLGPSQCVTLPYGLDLVPIEAERAEFSIEDARREAKISKSADVLLCVGTVEPRKAQIPLAHAFDLIADRHPDAHLVIVGAGENADSLALRDWIDEAERGSRVRLVPVTPDIHSWYALADLLVCASDIESLPRTVLEAMAFETPVLATEVFGIPELIEHGRTGWLCEPRDVNALAEALDRFLSTPEEERAEVARAARKLVEERHHLPEYANRVATLLSSAVDGHVAIR